MSGESLPMLRRLGDDPRSPFLALVLAAAMPLVLFGGWIGLRSAMAAREAARQDAVEIAAGVGERIEAELAAQLSAASALATSTALDRPDLSAFYTEAQRLNQAHPLWHTIELTDPDGAQV